ncbi:uncharacterized protein LOC106662093 [Cimex lectularius]|uniref:Uncharacterized protein n=1 Tax=Cimex lectularius TaxID=79782 RepID=A0A8I6R8U7_CIMLE|nr:uncharacterized protein LOC106662093 [Cimex lectularius]
MRKVASACFPCCVKASDQESDVGSYFEYVVHNHYIYKMKIPKPDKQTRGDRQIFRRRKRRGIHPDYSRSNTEGDLRIVKGSASVRDYKRRSYPKDVYGEPKEFSSEDEGDWEGDRFSNNERSYSAADVPKYSATTSPYCNEDSLTPGDQTHDSNSASDRSDSSKHIPRYKDGPDVRKKNKKNNFTSVSIADASGNKTLLRRI